MKLLVAFALLSIRTGLAAETPSTALLVLSKEDHALIIVDPATLQAVGQVPSGPDPHEVIASADGKIAYISNYGGGAYNTITVVDLVSRKAMPAIDLGPLRGPHGLVFAGGKLWFTAEGAKVIGSYDPATRKVDWVLGTGQNRTHMIFVASDAQRMITSNISSATMTFVDKTGGEGRGRGQGPGPGGRPQAEWNETVVPVGRGAEGFDVSPDGKEIWAANAQDGTVSILDWSNKKVLDTLHLDVQGANRLKFAPDGKLVFITTLSGPNVSVVDAITQKVVKQIKVGTGAAGILMQPDGKRVFVACTPDDYVAVIDLQTLEVTGQLRVGKKPDGLAWALR